MKKILLLLLPALLIATSCTPSHFLAADYNPSQLNEVTILDPAANIELVRKGKGNRSEYSPELSDTCRKNLLAGLSTYFQGRCRVEQMELDSATKVLVDHQVAELMWYNQQSKSGTVPFPPAIDSVMEVHGIEFAICALQRGFAREKGNYGAQVAKGVLLGIVTLGTVYTVPVKAVSELQVCLLDGRNNRVVFYNRNVFQDQDPDNKMVTDNQIERLFSKMYN